MDHRSAYCAGQSDPRANRQFCRPWAIPDATKVTPEPGKPITLTPRVSPARIVAARELVRLTQETG
jgi:hypothetical protein